MDNSGHVRPRTQGPWRYSLRTLLLAVLLLFVVIGYRQARQHRATEIIANYARVVDMCENALRALPPGTAPAEVGESHLSLTAIEEKQMRTSLFAAGRTNMTKHAAIRVKLSDELTSEVVARGVKTGWSFLEHYRSGFKDAGIDMIDNSTTPFPGGVISQAQYATSGNRIIVLVDVLLQPEYKHAEARITAIDAQELGWFPW